LESGYLKKLLRLNKVMGQALVQPDWHLHEKRLSYRHTQREDHADSEKAAI
jgi:hypothetical protein